MVGSTRGKAALLTAWLLASTVLVAAPFAQAEDAKEDKPQCSDKIDNDNDGYTDFPDDPDCASPKDDKEAKDGGGGGNGGNGCLIDGIVVIHHGIALDRLVALNGAVLGRDVRAPDDLVVGRAIHASVLDNVAVGGRIIAIRCLIA